MMYGSNGTAGVRSMATRAPVTATKSMTVTIRAVATPATLGGRGSAAAKVRWAAPDGPQEHDTDTPATFVADLVARFGGEVPELTVTRPSLEDAYLSMIQETA